MLGKMPKAILYEAYNSSMKQHILSFDKNFEIFKKKIKEECKLDDINNYKLVEVGIDREIEDKEDYELMKRDLNGQKRININIVKKNNK